jgi:DnaK suppressor protein
MEGKGMTDDRLDGDFIAKQKRRLLGMKAELERMRHGLEGDARWWREEEEDFTQHDSGDRSLSLFTRELDLTIEKRVKRRLKIVERALQKIDEGTYGICDDTGDLIPKERLEAVPEAIYTIEAQNRREELNLPPL